MQQFDVNKRFHLIARRRDNNQDEILFEFDEEFNMNYYMDLVDETIYKSAAILDYSTQYPTCPMSREFPDYTPYFDKIKKLERKK
jgi:hypothetical protein